MSVIVTDNGFQPDDWQAGFQDATSWEKQSAQGLHLASDTDPADLADLCENALMIRINFPSFADGRGFTLAKQLRGLGYQGRLRAVGHVLSDQYAMLRRSGFDEAEISDDLAARQPETEWLFRADWAAHNYQTRLGRA